MSLEDQQQQKNTQKVGENPFLSRILDILSFSELGKPARRAATFGSILIAVVLVVFGMRAFYLNAGRFTSQALVSEEKTPLPTSPASEKGGRGGYMMPSFEVSRVSFDGLERSPVLHTSI
ncbi:MAG: hypothetical protein KGY39_05950, partial [Anaerolineales bacterium]|nr:hypothetical protein [Anaerolineales bacterium]